jgi:hypothetical protein
MNKDRLELIKELTPYDVAYRAVNEYGQTISTKGAILYDTVNSAAKTTRKELRRCGVSEKEIAAIRFEEVAVIKLDKIYQFVGATKYGI